MAGFFNRGLVPRAEDATATVTFIKLEDRTYAVTAWHVVDVFSRQGADENATPEAYFLPAGSGVILQPPLLRPPGEFMIRQPDIALRQVENNFPARIGKEAYEVRETPTPKFPITHALAVGYPTASKWSHGKSPQERLGLTCVWAVAEGVGGGDTDQVQFFSELDELPEVEALSGMSGGPVFWSEGEAHGLVGFVKEAPAVVARGEGDALTDKPRVQIVCQRASYDDLLRWTTYADENWNTERAELNAASRGSARPGC